MDAGKCEDNYRQAFYRPDVEKKPGILFKSFSRNTCFTCGVHVKNERGFHLVQESSRSLISKEIIVIQTLFVVLIFLNQVNKNIMISVESGPVILPTHTHTKMKKVISKLVR